MVIVFPSLCRPPRVPRDQPRSEKAPSTGEVPLGAIWDVNVEGCPCGQPSKTCLVDDLHHVIRSESIQYTRDYHSPRGSTRYYGESQSGPKVRLKGEGKIIACPGRSRSLDPRTLCGVHLGPSNPDLVTAFWPPRRSKSRKAGDYGENTMELSSWKCVSAFFWGWNPSKWNQLSIPRAFCPKGPSLLSPPILSRKTLIIVLDIGKSKQMSIEHCLNTI